MKCLGVEQAEKISIKIPIIGSGGNSTLLHLWCKLTGCDPYDYVLDTFKTLSDYNMEKQGDIIADYFSYFHDNDINRIVSSSGIAYQNNQKIYDSVLLNFTKAPSSANLLP